MRQQLVAAQMHQGHCIRAFIPTPLLWPCKIHCTRQCLNIAVPFHPPFGCAGPSLHMPDSIRTLSGINLPPPPSHSTLTRVLSGAPKMCTKCTECILVRSTHYTKASLKKGRYGGGGGGARMHQHGAILLERSAQDLRAVVMTAADGALHSLLEQLGYLPAPCSSLVACKKKSHRPAIGKSVINPTYGPL